MEVAREVTRTIPSVVLSAILCVLPFIVDAAGEVSSDGPIGPSIAAIEKLYFKKEIRQEDLPKLEKGGRKDEATMEGVPCQAEWFVIDRMDYVISKTSCADKALAYVIFKITNKKDQKANMTFYVAFYDSDGDGIFERVSDMKDRPLPSWVKERYAMQQKGLVERPLDAGAAGD